MKINVNTLLLVALLGFFYVNSQHNRTRVKAPEEKDSDKLEIVVKSDSDVQEPRRHYDSRYYPRRAMAINVPTRGEPPPYQQVGYLSGSEDPENIKPLYGRQTYRGSNQWNYFTSLDSHLATKIPVTLGTTDCTDERGCKELYKNDAVNINGTDYNANIYGTIAPRYIPY